MILNKSKGIALFTDGSAWHESRIGGWAFIAIDCFGAEEADFGWTADTTNNRMEIQAWIEGLKFLHESIGPAEVLVYSDSEYVGLGAMDRQRHRGKNRDLWNKLDGAIGLHDYVEFVHVKGHSDNYYNNLVDSLAGEARLTATYLAEAVYE